MSERASDLNLLFGMLANQLNFVSGQQLIDAMHLWVANKSRPLGSILVEQGWLTTERQTLIDALVEEHVRAHEGDAARSLADVQPIKETLSRLNAIGDPDVEHSLAPVNANKVLATGAPESPEVMPTMAPEISISAAPARFRNIRLHDQGGIGKVWLSEDTELHRQVALKEIRAEYADDEASRNRFILEAEVTGGLEHPGIVPVYGLGRHPDGRPYYAMRFIRGSSLRKCISEFHRTDWKQREAGERAIELRRLLGCFLDACHAVDYAHSRGILHRDLKPANVMVGEYGETLVVDWGLAKPAGEESEADKDEPTPRPLLRPASMSVSNPTVLGAAMGSPAFMSPEQARGEHDQLGPQTDIYGLGATLYVLLTNQTAFLGSEYAEVLERVKLGEWDPPRTVKSDVPRPLDAICCKAMQLDPKDRYATVAEMARELERYLADEPVLSYEEGPVERLARLARRYRTVVRAIAVALLAITAISIVFAVSFNFQKTEAERAREAADNVRDYLVNALRSPSPEHKGREVTVAEVLDQAQETLDQLESEPLQQADLADAIGKAYHGLGLHTESAHVHERAYLARASELGSTHLKTLESKNELALAYLELGDVDRALPMFTETLEQRRLQLGNQDPFTAESEANLGIAYFVHGDIAKSIPLLKGSLESRQSDPNADPEETLKFSIILYSAYAGDGQLDIATQGLENLMTQAEEHLTDKNPNMLMLLANLGSCYYQIEKHEQAIPLLTRALEGRIEVLGDAHPHTINTQKLLATTYMAIERADRALPLSLDLHQKGQDQHTEIVAAVGQAAKMALALAKSEKLDEAASIRADIDAAMLALDDVDNSGAGAFYAAKVHRGRELMEAANYAEAEQHLLEAAQDLTMQTTIEPFHYRVIYTYESLVELYDRWNRPEEAAAWKEKLNAAGRLDE